MDPSASCSIFSCPGLIMAVIGAGLSFCWWATACCPDREKPFQAAAARTPTSPPFIDRTAGAALTPIIKSTIADAKLNGKSGIQVLKSFRATRRLSTPVNTTLLKAGTAWCCKRQTCTNFMELPSKWTADVHHNRPATSRPSLPRTVVLAEAFAGRNITLYSHRPNARASPDRPLRPMARTGHLTAATRTFKDNLERLQLQVSVRECWWRATNADPASFADNGA